MESHTLYFYRRSIHARVAFESVDSTTMDLCDSMVVASLKYRYLSKREARRVVHLDDLALMGGEAGQVDVRELFA